MSPQAELSGVAVVAVGAFNPPIFHPSWLQDNELIAANEAEHALGEIVLTHELTAFSADWLNVQVTTDQAVFATVEVARERQLRDVARGIFELLPQTPVDAVGINSDTHFRTESEEKWHELGDRFSPKDFWRPIFTGGPWIPRTGSDEVIGLRSLTVEVHRDDATGYMRVQVAPSVRLAPYGIYIGINSHRQLSPAEERGTGQLLSRFLSESWDEVRELERGLEHDVLAAAE